MSAGAIVLVFMLPPPMLTQLVHIAEQQPPIGAARPSAHGAVPAPSHGSL